MVGEIETNDEGVLVVRRIDVRYRLQVDALDDRRRAAIDRVMGFHRRKCPVAVTLEGRVEISTSIEVEVLGGE